MAMYMFPGPMELLLLLLLGSGGGLPMGMPPGPEDPVMSHVAPEECLLYVSWAGMATPDPDSPNQTEQLLAEPEIRFFAAELERSIVESLKKEAERAGETAVVDNVHLLVRTVLTHPTAVFLSKVEMGGGKPDVYAGAVVNLGDNVAAVRSALLDLEKMAFRDKVTEVELGGNTWRSLPVPEGSPPVLWSIKSKYLVVGIGRGEAERIYSSAQTKAPEWLVDLRRQAPVARPANVMYVNLGQIVKKFGPLMGREGMGILEALGLANVRSLGCVTGLDETGCVSKMLIGTEGELTGLLSLASAEPLSKDDLAVIPKDATVAAAARFDLGKAYQQLLEIAGKIDPRAREEMAGGMSEVDQVLGLSIAEDVFASLGDRWRVYNSPSEGGLIVTGLTAVVDLKDHDKLVAANTKLVLGTLAKEAARAMQQPGRRPRGAMVSQCKHGDQTIFFLNVIGEEFPFAPAWTITDDELVVALYPQNVKAFLDRKAAGGGGSLADVPEVAAALGGDQPPVKVVYCDTRAIFKLVYPLVQIGAQMICGEIQREGIDVNVSILPSAPSILRHLQPGVIAVRKTEGGILVESRQTLPVGGGATVLPTFMFMGVAVRSTPGPVFATSRVQSMNNMKQIALAMHNYHDSFKGFPAAAGPMKEGQPPVSWRVRVLPYVEQQALYEQYHFDEPWDSENNKKLIPLMPETYRSPGSNAGQGMTNYQVVVGEGMAFSADKPSRMADFRDGTSNTIMAVEVSDAKAVPWTKPEDFTPDKKNPIAGLLGLERGGFLAGFTDGSVRIIPGGISPRTLNLLFTRADGQPINHEEIDEAPRSAVPMYEAGPEIEEAEGVQEAVPVPR